MNPVCPGLTPFQFMCMGCLALWTMILPSVAGAEIEAGVRAEIEALFARLETSHCEFQRNGKAYSASDARAHLLRKLAYLEAKGTVSSTEQFIELAASKSSLSGKSYLVLCPSTAPLLSATWLISELHDLRALNK